MKLSLSFLVSCSMLLILARGTSLAIEPNQWDNFQGGTTLNWTSGAVNPNPPIVVLGGGPVGAGDAYLLVTATGNQGAGGRMIAFNQTQWTGNYVSAGVTIVSMHLNNYSTSPLSMRIVVRGAGGDFWSVSPVNLPAQSGWQIVQFSLAVSDLTGGVNLTTTLSNVTEVRIIHSAVGGIQGDVVNATLGIDNITAAENPLPVELISFTANQSGNSVLLNWITASEINNSGFEIERSTPNQVVWETIGFVQGNGTSIGTQNYIFTDRNLNAGNYHYRLKQIDFDGSYVYSSIVNIEIHSVEQFSLGQNYPNPFNPSTILSWQSPEQGHQTITVYDVLGNEVARLVDEMKPTGYHSFEFNATGLSSGIYYYRLQAGNFSEVKKMTLIR